MGIICACLSTLRPLLTRMLPAAASGFKRENASSGETRNQNNNLDDRDPILLSGLQCNLNHAEGKDQKPQLQWPRQKQGDRNDNAFQKLEDKTGTPFPPDGSWVQTDVSRASDPDLEGLGDDFPSAIIKSQTIVQNSTDRRSDGRA